MFWLALKKKILIIDDDRSIVKFHSTFLEQQGYEVLKAYDGKEGLEILKKEDIKDDVKLEYKDKNFYYELKNKAIDLIILDLDMPKMNGSEFLKRIREDHNLDKARVIVFTSLDVPFQARRDEKIVKGAQNSGVNKRGWDQRFKFIRKQNVRTNYDLFLEVEDIMSKPLPIDYERREYDEWKVLIVDDDEELRKKIEKSLLDSQTTWDAPSEWRYLYKIFHANNGTEALKILGDLPIDLVILDIDMPETNGEKVLELMKSNFVINNIPVIINSSMFAIDKMNLADRVIKKKKGSQDDFENAWRG